MSTDRADYMRDYRATNQPYVDADNKRKRARSRALTRLRRMHRLDYTRLYEEELAKEVDASA